MEPTIFEWIRNISMNDIYKAPEVDVCTQSQKEAIRYHKNIWSIYIIISIASVIGSLGLRLIPSFMLELCYTHGIDFVIVNSFGLYQYYDIAPYMLVLFNLPFCYVIGNFCSYKARIPFHSLFAILTVLVISTIVLDVSKGVHLVERGSLEFWILVVTKLPIYCGVICLGYFHPIVKYRG